MADDYLRHSVVEVIYRYGLRRNEAATIRREHLRDGRIWITREKGGISGEYPIHPATRRLLWTYFALLGEDESPYLFVSRQSGNQPISPSTIYGLFRRYADAADLPVDRSHPHVLRHSIAVHLMNAGWDAVDVQDWLGHRDIASTMSTPRSRTVVANKSTRRRFSPMRSLQMTPADGLAQKRQLTPASSTNRSCSF